ncbi:signal peptidase I [Paenibacillus algorifonticola]|uniref:signal peptidase I n=1 Tax=Paenibacillus algorifonticola TaxID=684063 RepID=UPI003D2BF6B5
MDRFSFDGGSSGEAEGQEQLGALKRPGWSKELWEWVKTVGISFILVTMLHLFVFNLSTVEGHSMEPTLQEKEWLFVNKFVYLIGTPKIGDVVILEDPSAFGKEQELLVKRVVGLPGDRIEISDKHLYRNGELVDEPYIDTEMEDLDMMPLTVEAGSYYVMGDNRHARASKDSRMFGTVPIASIEGKAQFIVWPYKQIKPL